VQTKVTVDLFGLFAEVERDLISEGTKEGLAAARAKSQLRGRPKGALILVANRPEWSELSDLSWLTPTQACGI